MVKIQVFELIILLTEKSKVNNILNRIKQNYFDMFKQDLHENYIISHKSNDVTIRFYFNNKNDAIICIKNFDEFEFHYTIKKIEVELKL